MTRSTISKRRRRRLRGKMRVSPAAESIRLGLQQAISIVEAIDPMQMDQRHENLNRRRDD